MKQMLLIALLLLLTMLAPRPAISFQGDCNIPEDLTPNLFPYKAIEQILQKTDDSNPLFNETCKNKNPFVMIEQMYSEGLRSVDKFIAQTCINPTQSKHSFCQFNTYYKIYLETYNYLDTNSRTDNSTIRINHDNNPSNFHADLLGLNWHLDYYASQKSHAEIIRNILALEYSSRAIELLTYELNKYLAKMHSKQSLDFRRTKLQFIQSYSKSRDPLLWMLDIALAPSCMPTEKLCKSEKDLFLFDVYQQNANQAQWISNYKAMVIDYSPKPWPEAEELKSIYLLNNIISGIRALSLSEIQTAQASGHAIEHLQGAQQYIQQMQKLTLHSTGLNNIGRIQLYREIIALDNYIQVYDKLSEIFSSHQIIDSSKSSEIFYKNINNAYLLKFNKLNNFFSELEGVLVNEIK